MGASILVIKALDSPEWNADVYGALSSLSRLAAAMQSKANVIKLAFILRRMNRNISSLFETVKAAEEGRLKPDANAEVPTPQRLMDSSDKLMKMSRYIEYLYELLRRVGLTNNSLTAGNLKSIKCYSERIVDLADWFEAMAQSKEIEAIYERATGERERGEIFDLERI